MYKLICIVLLFTPQYTSYVNTNYMRCEGWVSSQYVSAQFPFLHVESTWTEVCGFAIFLFYLNRWGTPWRSWLRHCATSRKVAVSFPDGVSGIFHWHNPSGRNMGVGLTQPPTEMSTRNIFWGKDGPCVWMTTLSSSCTFCFEIWEPHTPGTFRACTGL